MAGLAGLLVGTLGLPTAAVAAPAPAPQTQLSATDLALMNGVRLAGLWEMPAGQIAAQRGSRERVREVGAEIAAQHADLDQLVVDAANKLGVQLPDKPTDEQQGWLNEMRDASSGREVDQIFVDRLRAAHGKIFPIVNAVRAGTRNEVVRQLAQDTNGFVMTHMTLLESTGIVRYQDLPGVAVGADRPASDSLQGAAVASVGGINTAAIWAGLVIALLLGGLGTYRMFRPR
ncbi:DUF4142 domain-containing protein [Actinomycetes bacterium KLBMP 9797]